MNARPPIYIVKNKRKNRETIDIPTEFSAKETRFARAFHQSFANYEPTPLVSLPALAREWGVGKLLVKDESKRFGLNAFKVLGASYAMACYLCEKLGLSMEEMTFDKLCSPEMREKVGEVTFVTATDGNHGRAVAWAAKSLGQHAVVYLPKGSTQERVDAIREAGAQAHVINGNYDEAVRLSEQIAKERGWQVIQDTAWEDYTIIPTWIMQGYTTMAAEAIEQLAAITKAKQPTHVFLQAGVGSMAAAVLGYLIAESATKDFVTVIVEPHTANCMVLSAENNDGQPHAATGSLQTIMAGLACGEPNPIAWSILQEHADFFVSCADYVAANGMRILAAPTGDDPSVVSGESGAVGIGLLASLMTKPMYAPQREQLGLSDTSVVLCFSTEGDTDRSSYRSIVWEGTCSEEA